MIALSTEAGVLLKVWAGAEQGLALGFHPRFGFASRDVASVREKNRRHHGLRAVAESWRCLFRLSESADGFSVQAEMGCEATEIAPQRWKLATAFGNFILASESAAPWVPVREQEKDHRGVTALLIAAMLLAVGSIWFLNRTQELVVEEIPEPVLVQIEKPRMAVKVPTVNLPKLDASVAQKPAVQRAVQQELGFLGLLGRQNIKNAVGGAPTTLRDASPGAGAGGKEGSGGELLQGLGKGLQKTTVGNSGVAGLGGIGTKGAGGGAGGYGNAMVGGGGAARVSSLTLSNDLVLDGGLDPSVVQATIAKYLSQVRACYEDGLRVNAGLSGLVKTRFEVSGSGSVSMAEVLQSTLGSKQVESCIVSRIRTWQFPKPLGGTSVKVSYPFLLRPVGNT